MKTQQGPSASAYVTYCVNNDALRAIQSVNNIMIDGRLVKTSLGTTKYCSHFMKNQSCPKPDCMYLHDLGDPEASFTKEEMHQGKHQEYEKRLHDALIAQTNAAAAAAAATAIATATNATTTTVTTTTVSATSSSSSVATCASSSSSVSSSASSSSSSTSSAGGSSGSSASSESAGDDAASAAANGGVKDAWPSLSVSPVNGKEMALAKNGNGKATPGKDTITGSAKKSKDRSRNKKSTTKDKQSPNAAAATAIQAQKNTTSTAVAATNHTASNNSNAVIANATAAIVATVDRKMTAAAASPHKGKPSAAAGGTPTSSTTTSSFSSANADSNADEVSGFEADASAAGSLKITDAATTAETTSAISGDETLLESVGATPSSAMRADEELNMLSEIENDALALADDDEDDEDDDDEEEEEDEEEEAEEKVETTSSSLSGSGCVSRSISESASGKSTPADGTFPEHCATLPARADMELVYSDHAASVVKSPSNFTAAKAQLSATTTSDDHIDCKSPSTTSNHASITANSADGIEFGFNSTDSSPKIDAQQLNGSTSAGVAHPPGIPINSGAVVPETNTVSTNSLVDGLLDRVLDTSCRFSFFSSRNFFSQQLTDDASFFCAARFGKMDLFDDNSSFFSNTNTFPHTYFKLDQQAQQLGNGNHGATNSPQLPDLLNGTETNNKERIDIDKLNLLKELGGFNVQSGYSGTSGECLATEEQIYLSQIRFSKF